MSKTTEVVAVETRTIERGLEVEITVARVIGRYVGVRPDPADVPPDVREALRAWLGDA